MSAHLIVPDKRIMRGAELSWFDKKIIVGSGRSWWQVRYESGKILSEWQTKQSASIFLPTRAKARTTRWEEIAKQGIRGLYLLCPNGQCGALESNGDYQFFQLKSGTLTVGKGGGTTCEAHVIGKVDDDNGKCTCWAWEYEEKRLVRFVDNVTHLAYRNIGPLSLGHHTGVK